MKQKKVPAPVRPPREKRTFRQWLRANLTAVLVLAGAALLFACACLYIYRDGSVIHEAQAELSYVYERAEVLAVTQDTVDYDRSSPDGRRVGSQTMLVRLLSGAHKGENVEMTNNVSLFGSLEYAVGDKLIVYQYYAEDGTLTLETYMFDRTLALVILVLVFFAVTTLVGGRTGLKSLLGLVITVGCVIFLLCPLLMLGWPVVPTTFLICGYVAVVSFVLLGGVSQKILCAICGTVAGMALAGVFGVLAQKLMRIDSYAMYDSSGSMLEALQQIQLQDIPLHLNGLLTAGILISSLGAVMDVAMSLSSAMQELKTVNPAITRRQLWHSAMNIGRDMVGTMTNTLILAFVGSSLIMILYLWALNPDSRQLLPSRFLAVEVISAVSSSIGVILAVPLTALVGVLFFSPHTEK